MRGQFLNKCLYGGRREVRNANLTNEEDPNWEADNHQGREENGEYQEEWGEQRRDVLFAGNANGYPSDFAWVTLGTMGPIVRRNSIFKTMRRLRVTRNCETKRMLRPAKYSPKIKYCAIGKVNFGEPLSRPKENSGG